MKKESTNDVHSRSFESKLDPAFRSSGEADYKPSRMRRRKTGGRNATGARGGNKWKSIREAVKGHQQLESDAILGV